MNDRVARARLGVDIGGTFTDVVVSDENGALAYVGKFPSDTAASAMLGGIDAALAATGIAAGQVELVVHATTRGTNALLQNTGARVALVTTEGFRDVLELGRGRRPSLYDLQFDKMEPLIPRERRLEVAERMRHDGSVERALDEASVRRLIPELAAMELQSVAICLLHAYANPAHERAIEAILAAALPDLRVIASHRVLAEAKEFERTTTTTICATLAPLLHSYLEEVTAGLQARGVPGRLFVMHSGGGLLRPRDVGLRAHTLVESGPAAGVLAAAHLIRTELPDDERAGGFVTFDMGGTTAKAFIVQNGEFAVTNDYEVGRGSHESYSVRLSGYPIKSPVIDLIESGQGGGSIAWADATGVLRVGPLSAGAIPGPACYGRGGSLPTVTDCNLVLGRLNPETFAGGTLGLQPDLARQAIETHLCARLGTGVAETAAAVIRVVNAAMARSVRVISVQRGIDPRGLAMIAFGGGGPLHASELGIARILVPRDPGVFSAVGLVRGNPRMDFSQACEIQADRAGLGALRGIFAGLGKSCDAWIAETREAGQLASVAYHADMRYRGQGHVLVVPIETAWLQGDATIEARRAFDTAHRALYSFDTPHLPVDIMVCRATGTIALDGADAAAAAPAAVPGRADHERRVFFSGRGFLPTRIVDRRRLAPGEVVVGPAMIEEETDSFLIPPEQNCIVRDSLILDLNLR